MDNVKSLVSTSAPDMANTDLRSELPYGDLQINFGKNTVKSMISPPTEPEELTKSLEAASIPVTFDPCRTCANPCQDDDDQEYHHEEWPRMDVDTSSDMLGSVKPYYRQVVISTGRSDWPREVTEVSNTLAYQLNQYISTQKVIAKDPKDVAQPIKGLFNPSGSTRLGILNGSHHSHCDDEKHTVLVFPDYKIIAGVEATSSGASAIWKQTLEPSIGLAGQSQGMLRSWVLPYNAVLLLCSHKRRDNKCAIAAPVLKRGLTAAFEAEGWEVHDQPEDPDHFDASPIETITGSPEEREAEVVSRLRAIGSDPHDPGHQRALILFCSHTGGHKFAGNIIIYTPTGSGVWYGRVTSHEIEAVTKTITEGRIYPALLRGGVNLSRASGQTLLDW